MSDPMAPYVVLNISTMCLCCGGGRSWIRKFRVRNEAYIYRDYMRYAHPHALYAVYPLVQLMIELGQPNYEFAWPQSLRNNLTNTQ